MADETHIRISTNSGKTPEPEPAKQAAKEAVPEVPQGASVAAPESHAASQADGEAPATSSEALEAKTPQVASAAGASDRKDMKEAKDTKPSKKGEASAAAAPVSEGKQAEAAKPEKGAKPKRSEKGKRQEKPRTSVRTAARRKRRLKDLPALLFPAHVGDLFTLVILLVFAAGATVFYFLAWLPTHDAPVQEVGGNIQRFSEQELDEIIRILEAREEASTAPVIPPVRDPFN